MAMKAFMIALAGATIFVAGMTAATAITKMRYRRHVVNIMISASDDNFAAWLYMKNEII